MLVGIFDPEVVVYAAKLEYGDHPFIRPAIDANIDKINREVDNQIDLLFLGKTGIDKAKKDLGDFIVSLIKHYIEDAGLVKTGTMRDSVDVVIR